MSTSEGLSAGRSGDSQNRQLCLVVNGNVTGHLTHNAILENTGKCAHFPLDRPTIGLQAQSPMKAHLALNQQLIKLVQS
jgi:hypothetical protein